MEQHKIIIWHCTTVVATGFDNETIENTPVIINGPSLLLEG